MKLTCKTILNCDGEPYLRRWYLLRTRPVAVFVHQFLRSDEDRALHDHPWWYLVIPIRRGYREWTEAGCRRVWPLIGTRLRPARHRHRVELIDGRPAWSIFVRFRRVREWGFWPGGRWVHWKQWHINNQCE